MDPRLWRCCAGRTITLPAVDSKVFYFVEGHGEQALGPLHVGPDIPRKIAARVVDVTLKANACKDEVYAVVQMIRVPPEEEDEEIVQQEEGLAYDFYCKTLTDADAGRLQFPNHWGCHLFPPLPEGETQQTVSGEDVFGISHTFLHVTQGSTHALTDGWGSFVCDKFLLPHDTVVLVRVADGFRIGIRRQRDNLMTELESMESIRQIAERATRGLPFNVTYYPRLSTPFIVSVATVKAALELDPPLVDGERIGRLVESDDSRLTTDHGTVLNPLNPNYNWRQLPVQWDADDDPADVNPWTVHRIRRRCKQGSRSRR